MSPFCVELIDKCPEMRNPDPEEHSRRDLEEKLSEFAIKVKVLPVTLAHSDTSL